MIYFVTALYCEAKPLIDYFSLKKNSQIRKFQIFEANEVCLVLSKPGKLNAAIATTYLLTVYPPDQSSILINLGIAGCKDGTIPIGSAWIGCKLTDSDTQTSYYPDLLVATSLSLAMVETHSKIVTSSDTVEPIGATGFPAKESSSGLPVLVDMEAVGVFAASHTFLQPHQIVVAKVVSDHLDSSPMTPDMVTELIANPLDAFILYIHNLSSYLSNGPQGGLDSTEYNLFLELATQLSLSVTMTHQLEQIFRYAKLNGINIINYIHQIQDQQLVKEICTKKEGKCYFEHIRNELT